MGLLKERMQQAFAVDPPGPAEPTAEQQEVVDWFCRQVAKRHLTTPGLIALEVSRPLNFIASQTMHFFAPAVWGLARPTTTAGYEQFAKFLERRGSMEYLADRIEHFDNEYQAQEKSRSGADDDGAVTEKDHDDD